MKTNLLSLKEKIFEKKFLLRARIIKGFLLLGFLTFSSNILKSQLIQVTSDVGTGTTYNGSTAYPAPYGHFYWSSHHQLFIPPADIAAAGVAPGGTITALGFNVFAKNTQTILSNWEMKVYTTMLADPLATGFITNGQVSSGGPQIALNATTGWNMHSITPFIWDGISGLVIETCHSHASGYTENASMYWTTTLTGSSIKSRWGNTDAQPNTCTTAQANTSANTRQNVRIAWEGINCSAVPASTAAATFTNICGGAGSNVMIPVGTYTNIGYTYQWESSSNGINGVYSSVPNATNSAMSTGTLSNSMAYRIVVTCTNGPVNATSAPVLVNVGPPSISNAVAAIPLICPGGTGSLSLGFNYAGLGVAYQWQSSTVNIVGPYGNVTSGTNAATSGTVANFVDPNLTTTTYYQAILSCTAAPSLSSISVPVAVNIAGTMTNSVPYLETFEGILVNNQMPNCSWSASSPTTICQTYTAANTNNRIGYNSNKYASFRSGTNPNGDYFYTNGVQLEPGITYSASIQYITDGTLAWTELSLLLGTTQSAAGLTHIVSVNSSIIANTFYKDLSNTFTVPNSGIYYLAIKCKGASTGNYLTFDDVSITAPCSINSPTLAVTGPTAVCSGQPFLYSATGANTYLWTNTGVTTSTANLSLGSSAPVVVVGTSTASGCSTTQSVQVTVNPSPPVSVSAANNATYVCKGSSINLYATGAGQNSIYSWSSGTTGLSISVSPTVATTYTVVGLNANGCSGSAIQHVAVKTPPSVVALASSNQMCASESVTLTATGANSYTWSSNNNYLVGTQVVVSPFATTTYSVLGADAAKCEGSSFVAVAVFACLGVNEMNSSIDGINVYPNPNAGVFTLEFSNDNNKSIEVLDLTGRLVLATQSNDIKTEVNISELSAGIYYVKVRDERSSSVIKIVKQ